MIRQVLRQVLRDPLFHFLVLGAGLFFVYTAVNGSVDSAPKRIVVDQTKALRLAEQFQRTWMRPPTRRELEGLVDDYVKEEVLYREALALGLDRDDLVVRRRLRQKMEFINEGVVELRKPTAADLQAYFDANRDKFRQPDRFSFQQVYINSHKTSGDAKRSAKELLTFLNSNSPLSVDLKSIGDMTMLPTELDAVSGPEVDNIFGKGFAGKIENAPNGHWSGPFESSFGIHLVRLRMREPGGFPLMVEIRPLLEREWYSERRKEARDKFYRALRQRYDIEIRLPEAETGKTLAVR
jgi:hypothetical protein